MKVSNQLANMERGFAISPHTFMKLLSRGLQKRLQLVAPDIKTKLAGKTTKDNVITLNIRGVAPANSETADKVRMLMDELKNPHELLRLIEE